MDAPEQQHRDLHELFTAGFPSTAAEANAWEQNEVFPSLHSSHLFGGRGVYESENGPESVSHTLRDAPSSPAAVYRSSDEPESNDLLSFHSPPGLHRRVTPTTSTLTRLLGVRSATSPSSSRAPSYNSPSPLPGSRQSDSSQNSSLPAHIFARGYIDEKYADVDVVVFGKTYKLHRLIIDRALFFRSAFSDPWPEATAKTVELHPEEVDSNITPKAFELALQRLYGSATSLEEQQEAIGLFATACWLEMQTLVEVSVEHLLKSMRPQKLGPIFSLVTRSYYGNPGERLLASAIAMICKHGWNLDSEFWDDIPSEVCRDVVQDDRFFILNEWERWNLSKRLLDRRLTLVAQDLGILGEDEESVLAPNAFRMRSRRPSHQGAGIPAGNEFDSVQDNSEWELLYAHPDVVPLIDLLDEGINYMHMEFEELQYIKTCVDIFGVTLVPESTISQALWQSMELRHIVLKVKPTQAGLHPCDVPFVEAVTPQATPGRLQHGSAAPTFDKGSSMTNVGSATAGIEPGISDRILQNTKYSWHAPLLSSPSAIKGKGYSKFPFRVPRADYNIVEGGNTDRVATRTSQVARNSTIMQMKEAMLQRSWLGKPKDNFGNMESNEQYHSAFAPFRFSVEFPGPRDLKEDKRIYSPPAFYAGSWWHVYVIKLRSSNASFKIGIYLVRARNATTYLATTDARRNRASAPEPSVDERIVALERELYGPRDAHLPLDLMQPFQDAGSDQHGPSTRFSTTAYASSSSSSDTDRDMTSSVQASMPPVPTGRQSTIAPYRDERANVMAYFKISSPTKDGRVQSTYESAPDRFDFKRSRGWCSNLLAAEEGGGYLGRTDYSNEADDDMTHAPSESDGVGAKARQRNEERRLKFAITIGLV